MEHDEAERNGAQGRQKITDDPELSCHPAVWMCESSSLLAIRQMLHLNGHLWSPLRQAVSCSVVRPEDLLGAGLNGHPDSTVSLPHAMDLFPTPHMEKLLTPACSHH